MRRFAGLRLSERIPDEATILNFRHFLESRRLGKVIFDAVNRHLADAGLMLKEARKALPRGHAVPRGSARAHVDGWHLQGRNTSAAGFVSSLKRRSAEAWAENVAPIPAA